MELRSVVPPENIFKSDHPFRQLLSRMTHREATIDVVLRKGLSDDDKRRYDAEEYRYRQFFGDRHITFYSDGVKDFVGKLLVNA